MCNYIYMHTKKNKKLKFDEADVKSEDETAPTEVGDFYPDQEMFCFIQMHKLY